MPAGHHRSHPPRGVHEQQSPVLHPVVSLVSISPQCYHNHPARNPGAMASCRFLPLLALEISEPGRPTANRCGFAGIDPGDDRWKFALGCTAHWFVRKKRAFCKSSSEFAEFDWADWFRSRFRNLDTHDLPSDPKDKKKQRTVNDAVRLAHSQEAKNLPGHSDTDCKTNDGD